MSTPAFCGRHPSRPSSIRRIIVKWLYHLFKDLLRKTEGATWFEKVKDGDGRAAHLLLREHYVGEAHDMRRAAAANAKLETLFWN